MCLCFQDRGSPKTSKSLLQVHDNAHSEELGIHQQESVITLQTQEDITVSNTQASLDASTQTLCTADVGTETLVSSHQIEVECNAL